MNTAIISCDVNHLFLLETLKRGGAGNSVIIIDSRARKQLCELPRKVNIDSFSLFEVFFNYQKRENLDDNYNIFQFGTFGNSYVNGIDGLKMIDFKVPTEETKKNQSPEVRRIEGKHRMGLHCVYGYGENMFIGIINEYARTASISYVSYDGKKVLETLAEGFINQETIVRNKGKDIFVLIDGCGRDDEEIGKDMKILHLVNRDLERDHLTYDPDLIERLDYLRIMDDEKVSTILVSLLIFVF